MHSKRARATSAEDFFNSIADCNFDFILLRDQIGVMNGTFRDIDCLSTDFNKHVFEAAIKARFIIVKTVVRYCFYQYCLFDAHNRVFLLIDIWTKLTYRGQNYFDDLSILNTITCRKYMYLCEDSSLAVSVIKGVTQKAGLKTKYKDRMKNSSPQVMRILKQSNIEKLKYKKLWFNKSYFGWLYYIIRHTFTKKSLCIYLLGPDGAGKTTIARALMDSQIRADIIYYHGRIPFLPRISSITKQRVNKVKYSDRKKRFGILHALYYSVDGILASLRDKITNRADRLIISDRSMYDIIAREEYRRIPFWIQYMLVKSTPKPDYAFLLYADPVEIAERKPELPESEISDQYESYRKYSSILNLEEIETSSGKNSMEQMMLVIG